MRAGESGAPCRNSFSSAAVSRAAAAWCCSQDVIQQSTLVPNNTLRWRAMLVAVRTSSPSRREARRAASQGAGPPFRTIASTSTSPYRLPATLRLVQE